MNCLHTLPVLAAVERQLAGEPVVFVGVHSPKFPTEGDAEMVRQAIRRHGVTHPVAVDTGFKVWREYAVRAWPTLVLVGPDGVVLGAASGEPDQGPLLSVLTETLQRYEDHLVRGPAAGARDLGLDAVDASGPPAGARDLGLDAVDASGPPAGAADPGLDAVDASGRSTAGCMSRIARSPPSAGLPAVRSRRSQVAICSTLATSTGSATRSACNTRWGSPPGQMEGYSSPTR
ncbi:MAG: hypothetical protein ACRDZO_00185 [Egibacteraceae bacterium]